MKKFGYLFLCLAIVMTNVLIAHFFAGIGLFLIPVVVITISSIILFYSSDVNILLYGLLIYLFAGINDVGVKLYGSGIHDSEGQGWITMMLFLGLVPSVILFLVKLNQEAHIKFIKRLLSFWLFLLLIISHLYFLGNLGIGRSYPLN